ncbi:MAG: LuxR C-terminal-related transcriptional regulator [Pseudomonadota bacterium]
MGHSFETFLAALGNAPDLSALKLVFSDEIARFGYDGFDAFSHELISLPNTRVVPNFTVASYNPAWLEEYISQGYAEVCPVLTEIMQTMLPFEYLEFLDRCPPSATVAFQKRMLQWNRVEAAWCIPTNTVGSLRGVTVYMKNKGPSTRDRFHASRDDIATRARFFMEALLSHKVDMSRLEGHPRGDWQSLLSTREKDCLRYLLEGMSNPQIAANLSLSRNTVQFHLKNLYRKLDVSNRTEAVSTAKQLGWLIPH